MKKVFLIMTVSLSCIGYSQNLVSDTGGQALEKKKKTDIQLEMPVVENPPTGGIKVPGEKKLNMSHSEAYPEKISVTGGRKLRQELDHLPDGGDHGGHGQQIPKMPKGLDIS